MTYDSNNDAGILLSVEYHYNMSSATFENVFAEFSKLNSQQTKFTKLFKTVEGKISSTTHAI